MSSIDGKEAHDAFNRRMDERKPSTTQTGAKARTSGQKQQFQCEKAATNSEQEQGKSTSQKPYSQGCRIPRLQQYAMENVFQMTRTMKEMRKR
ncbi:hypothetical protein O181_110944 [Austropuccinia psidii MF-1]|uniref:Uncharacterized protein n=1 Tax=Austropuccinia psidii MF-1 TaxID=1389203 RepID=A0A9Q3JZ70_9BASI|nr:hypothetical protein [Austropuccinia psidii MF-1]